MKPGPTAAGDGDAPAASGSSIQPWLIGCVLPPNANFPHVAHLQISFLISPIQSLQYHYPSIALVLTMTEKEITLRGSTEAEDPH